MGTISRMRVCAVAVVLAVVVSLGAAARAEAAPAQLPVRTVCAAVQTAFSTAAAQVSAALAPVLEQVDGTVRQVSGNVDATTQKTVVTLSDAAGELADGIAGLFGSPTAVVLTAYARVVSTFVELAQGVVADVAKTASGLVKLLVASRPLVQRAAALASVALGPLCNGGPKIP